MGHYFPDIISGILFLGYNFWDTIYGILFLRYYFWASFMVYYFFAIISGMLFLGHYSWNTISEILFLGHYLWDTISPVGMQHCLLCISSVFQYVRTCLFCWTTTHGFSWSAISFSETPLSSTTSTKENVFASAFYPNRRRRKTKPLDETSFRGCI